MSREEFRPRREVNKNAKKGGPRDIKVGLLIPLPYRAAISSLILHLFYEYVNSLEDVVAYRFVYNIDEDIVESLDHNISLRHLDLILVSASFELDYINIARILYSLRILPRHREKPKPIVVAGGLAPTSNPMPLSGIVDAIVIGEAEDIISDIIYAARDEKPLRVLEGIKCVAIPQLKSKVKRCVVENLDAVYHPTMQVYSVDEEPIFGHGVRIEVSRGCPYLCPFCMEAHILYPFRYRSYSTTMKIIERGLNFNPITRRVIMYSLSFFSIPYVDMLLSKLLDEGVAASIPSLRVEHLTHNRLEIMNMLGQKTVTIAPETLVEHHGCRIGKCIDVEKISEIILSAYEIGYEHVKLYLMTGFPNLDIEIELENLEKLLNKVKSIRKPNFIEISLNLLIPKPWTPYQYLPPGYIIENSGRIKKYRELVKKYRTVRLSTMDPKWGFMQAAISQGDKNISNLIIECAIRGCSPTIFVKLINSNIDRYRYVYTGWGKNPPWLDTIDMGFNVKYLEYRFNYLTKFNK